MRISDAVGYGASAVSMNVIPASTRYLYDQLGNLVQNTAPSGATTVATYDTNGDKLSETDPIGAQHQVTYDFLGRPLIATSLERIPSTVTATTSVVDAWRGSNSGSGTGGKGWR